MQGATEGIQFLQPAPTIAMAPSAESSVGTNGPRPAAAEPAACGLDGALLAMLVAKAALALVVAPTEAEVRARVTRRGVDWFLAELAAAEAAKSMAARKGKKPPQDISFLTGVERNWEREGRTLDGVRAALENRRGVRPTVRHDDPPPVPTDPEERAILLAAKRDDLAKHIAATEEALAGIEQGPEESDRTLRRLRESQAKVCRRDLEGLRAELAAVEAALAGHEKGGSA
jgi:hypothetical protein